MSYKKFKDYGGLVSYDHKNRLIKVKRQLKSARLNTRLLEKLRDEYPEYTVVKNW